MDRHRALARVLPFAMACVGCPSGPKDPLPPEEGTAVASAAPGALGALAGGTDAAPPVVFAPRPLGESPESPVPELELDAGSAPDASATGNEELPL